MKTLKIKLYFLLLTLCFAASITAQVDVIYDPNSQFNIPDSVADNDTIINKNAFFSLFKGKPGRAAFYSLVIPSGGQVYNRKWWKVPIALGIDGALIYNVVYQNNQYRFYQDAYLTALVTKDPNTNILKADRDAFRKSKEYSWVYLVVGHLFTVIDAYVDRHLIEFDISDDISFSPYPLNNYSSSNFQAKVSIKLNINDLMK